MKDQIVEIVEGAITAEGLKRSVLAFGADLAGIAPINHPLLQGQRPDILKMLPSTRSLISVGVGLNKYALRSRNLPAANYEYKCALEQLNKISRSTVKLLIDKGAEALGAVPAWPMHMERLGADKIWDISHVPVAVASGLGNQGMSRLLLNPIYGPFVILGTIMTSLELKPDSPLEHRVCTDCEDCIKACPVQALSKEGGIDFFTCYRNSYKYTMPSFLEFAKALVDSPNSEELAKVLPDTEMLNLWQSISTGVFYQCFTCTSVCPVGERWKKREK